MKRRVLLARALVSAPDLLLLDEPTNHLDIESIDWLEQFLKSWNGALVFVTHDRRFLRALATRIVEIDRGNVTSWPGDFDNYQRRREERANAEAQESARFDKLLAQEETWIRQGIKARRTRDEGRVRRLEAMRNERAARREQMGRVKMEVAQGESSGKKVIEARDVNFDYGDRALVRDFSTTILRGDRVGLIGPNGSGKTTLLKLLLGQLAPQTGTVKPGTGLEVAYFDQQRASLREDWSAMENVSGGQDFVEIGGRRKHVLGYLQDFLFTPERARAPITRLSGGERNRLLLARLFAQPSNLLVMDEPTNDLDVETLELLEELLAEYPGTLAAREPRPRLPRSRRDLDAGDGRRRAASANTSAATPIGCGSAGRRKRAPVQTGKSAPARPRRAGRPSAGCPSRNRRNSNNCPRASKQLETRSRDLTDVMHDPAFYQRDSAAIVAHNTQLAEAQAQLDVAYGRWMELDAAVEPAYSDACASISSNTDSGSAMNDQNGTSRSDQSCAVCFEDFQQRVELLAFGLLQRRRRSRTAARSRRSAATTGRAGCPTTRPSCGRGAGKSSAVAMRSKIGACRRPRGPRGAPAGPHRARRPRACPDLRS